MEHEPFIFKGKLYDFEQKIVEFLLVDAEMNGSDPNQTIIYIYILLHRKLTQAQLAELTGFPKSKVSKITSKLVMEGILKKEFIPGTHTNEYMLIQQPFEMNFVPIEKIIQSFNEMTAFMENMIDELLKLPGKYRQDRDLLVWRLYDFCRYSRGCSQILEFNIEHSRLSKFTYIDKTYDLLTPQFRDHIREYLMNLDKSSTYLIDLQDEEIQKIEAKVIKFLLDHVIKEEKESISRILAYFMTRGKLTQNSIQQLTDFSSGTISQTLRYLLKEKKIDQIPTTRIAGNEYYYTMESISLMLLRHHASVYKDLIAWKPTFDEIKQQLNEHGNDLLFTDGYFSIYTITDKILTIFFTKYEQYLNQHERLLEINEKSIFQPSSDLN
ncbi:MAG: MarR family transcriptional regulator [Candidatus Lokiarchaeota archaeon]|nr:MarR family transcriptional regulator [Candidatus Harpocratesius repetitus]